MDNIIHYFLYCKLKMFLFINFVCTNIFVIKNIKTYDGKVNNNTFYYFMYKILHNITMFLKQYRDYFHVSTNKIHITKYSSNGDIHNIVSGDNLNFKNIQISTNDEKKINKRIFMKFSLIGNNKSTCLKEFLIKYKDQDKLYDHTLNNIFLFNDIKPNDSFVIDISFFNDKKKIINHKFPYNDVKDKHISYFDEME